MSVANFMNRVLGLKTDEEVKLEERVAILEAANAELSAQIAKRDEQTTFLHKRCISLEQSILDMGAALGINFQVMTESTQDYVKRLTQNVDNIAKTDLRLKAEVLRLQGFVREVHAWMDKELKAYGK